MYRVVCLCIVYGNVSPSLGDVMLSDVKFVVLDEADTLLCDNFSEDINAILAPLKVHISFSLPVSVAHHRTASGFIISLSPRLAPIPLCAARSAVTGVAAVRSDIYIYACLCHTTHYHMSLAYVVGSLL